MEWRQDPDKLTLRRRVLDPEGTELFWRRPAWFDANLLSCHGASDAGMMWVPQTDQKCVVPLGEDDREIKAMISSANRSLRLFGYVRVSDESQIEGHSLGEQEHQIRAHCEAKGFELVRIYRDEGISGRY